MRIEIRETGLAKNVCTRMRADRLDENHLTWPVRRANDVIESMSMTIVVQRPGLGSAVAELAGCQVADAVPGCRYCIVVTNDECPIILWTK